MCLLLATLALYLHLGHQLESHRLERLVFGHNGYGRRIGGVVAKLKVHAGGRGAHEVAAILRQAKDFLLDLGLVGVSDPGGCSIAHAALALDEGFLFLVERVENGLGICRNK